MLCVFLWPSVLGGVTLLRNVLVPGIFFPISWKEIKLLVFRRICRHAYSRSRPPRCRGFFPLCVGKTRDGGECYSVAEALLSSRSTDAYRGRRRADFGRRAEDDGARRARRSTPRSEATPSRPRPPSNNQEDLQRRSYKSRRRRYHQQKSALQKEGKSTLLTNLKQFTRVSWSVPRQIIKYCLSPTRCSGYIS